MNFKISNTAKETISGTLMDSALIIAAIPEQILDSEMKSQIEIALHNLQLSQQIIDNLHPLQDPTIKEDELL